MSDNKNISNAVGNFRTATDEVSYSGETADVQLVRLVGVTGSEGSKTVTANDIQSVLGATGDAAATAGGTGTLSAKERLMTTLLDQINKSLLADPAVLLHDNHDFSTTQTSTTLYTPTSGKKLALTSVRLSTGGTTAGLVTIYFGTGAYSAGTNKTIFRGDVAPSATNREYRQMTFPRPLIGADDEPLKVTTSAGVTIYIQWEGFEVD